MSIYSAMYTGVSGLMAEDDALGVIGNNLANTAATALVASIAIYDLGAHDWTLSGETVLIVELDPHGNA